MFSQWVCSIAGHNDCSWPQWVCSIAGIALIARFIGPTWGPSGADRTQVGPMLAPWTLLSGRVKLTPQGIALYEQHQRDHIESLLTHWSRVTHLCLNKLTIVGSDNGLSPGRRQAIIWTNAGMLLIGPLGTNFNEISIEINTFSFKKMRLKMTSGK